MLDNETPSEKDLAYYRAFIDGAFLANPALLEEVFIFLQTSIGSDEWSRPVSDRELDTFSKLLMTRETSASMPVAEDDSNVVLNNEGTSDVVPWSKKRKLKDEDLAALAQEGGFTQNALGRLHTFLQKLSEGEQDVQLWLANDVSATVLKRLPDHPYFKEWVERYSGPKPGSKARKLLDYMVERLSA